MDYIKNNFVPPRMFEKKTLVKLYKNSGTVYFDRQRLNSMINNSFHIRNSVKITLTEELNKIGYTKNRHFFTEKECRLIFNFISPPILTPKNIEFLLLKGLVRPEEFDKYNINYK